MVCFRTSLQWKADYYVQNLTSRQLQPWTGVLDLVGSRQHGVAAKKQKATEIFIILPFTGPLKLIMFIFFHC